ncbi:hypothetical protein KFE25_007137 [Diacronema lutheri]|uniref:UDP-N-acetylglucosamine transferase subunit ALG14 n=2 Tax=Diacronema lutheri TaxID=2081491 RepID=A0A8J5XYZ6_DIALT|nr:hypothetical protein KFE25_007137 [Diacronema lutheri]
MGVGEAAPWTAAVAALWTAVMLLVLVARGVLRARARRRGREKHVRVLAVLGSGGHTAEMLRLLTSLCQREEYAHVEFVLADTDLSSRASAELLRERLVHTERPFPPVSFRVIPRSREVGQSYLSSVLTTLRALVGTIATVSASRADLVLCNGPGTCLPVCLVARALTLVTLRPTVIVYVESMARVRSLSLTGRIVWKLGIADAFFVQWECLAARHPGTVFRGRLC